MIKQWWTQQSEHLGNWIFRKRREALQRRIQKQKALLSGSAKLTSDEMLNLRNETLRDVQSHEVPTASNRASTSTIE